MKIKLAMQLIKCVLFPMLMFSPFVNATVYWTAKINGVISTASGTAAIRLDGTPTSPNPSGTAWEACSSGFVFFIKKLMEQLLIQSI